MEEQLPREGRGLRMLTSYFYSPDGATIVSKVHAVTSYIQVECHLSLRHITSLAAHCTPWIDLASTSALVPGEKVNVIFFHSCPLFLFYFFLFSLSFSLSLPFQFHVKYVSREVQTSEFCRQDIVFSEEYISSIFRIEVIRMRIAANLY
jgi:hypothetical protein